MIETPSTKNVLFTRQERNEFLTTESRLVFNAKNGDFNPLLKFWRDKMELMNLRADNLGIPMANYQK
jgi:hypothetical protein